MTHLAKDSPREVCQPLWKIHFSDSKLLKETNIIEINEMFHFLWICGMPVDMCRRVLSIQAHQSGSSEVSDNLVTTTKQSIF